MQSHLHRIWWILPSVTSFLSVCGGSGWKGWRLLQCNEGPGFYCLTCFQNICTTLLYCIQCQSKTTVFFQRKGLQILTDQWDDLIFYYIYSICNLVMNRIKYNFSHEDIIIVMPPSTNLVFGILLCVGISLCLSICLYVRLFICL